ncbi:hypothetical protein ACLK2A_01805 [Escherichia coli]
MVPDATEVQAAVIKEGGAGGVVVMTEAPGGPRGNWGDEKIDDDEKVADEVEDRRRAGWGAGATLCLSGVDCAGGNITGGLAGG